jgi:hypothetical protein
MDSVSLVDLWCCDLLVYVTIMQWRTIFHSNNDLLSFAGGYLFSSSFDKTVRVWSLQVTLLNHNYLITFYWVLSK